MKRKSYFKNRGSKKPRTNYSNRKPRLSIKKYVQREIARNVENKTANTVVLDRPLYSTPSANYATGNTWQVSPNAVTMPISQGTGQGGRIGNVVKTKKLTFKGTLVAVGTTGTNPNPRPVQVRLVILYEKENPNAVPNVSSSLYQIGGTESGPRNDLVDMWAPINEDKYTVLTSKTFKIGFSQYDPAISPANGFWGNNDFKLNQNFSFDLTKHYLKMVKYNDNNSNPTTRGLFCTAVLAWADGSAIPANTIPVGMQYVLDYTYEDA